MFTPKQECLLTKWQKKDLERFIQFFYFGCHHRPNPESWADVAYYHLNRGAKNLICMEGDWYGAIGLEHDMHSDLSSYGEYEVKWAHEARIALREVCFKKDFRRYVRRIERVIQKAMEDS